jgi:hypothetical protein
VLGSRSERDESEIDPLRGDDAEIGTSYPAGLLAHGPLELVLGLDPASATAEEVGVMTIPSIGDERPIADHDMFQGSDRRQLVVEVLALAEKGQIEAGFHGQSLGRCGVSNP